MNSGDCFSHSIKSSLSFQPELLAELSYQGRVHDKAVYLTCQPKSFINQWVRCFWQLAVDHGDHGYLSVPDNCVDWIFDLSEPSESFIVTPFSSATEFSITGPATYFAVRFRVLGYQGLINTPLGEWQNSDHSVDAIQLVHRLVLEQMSTALYQSTKFDERCHYVSAVLERELKIPTIDRRLMQFIRSAFQGYSMGFNSIRLDCSGYGVSERQLRRLSQLHLGLSIKDFLKVARFQAALHSMNTRGESCGWAAHYYDQSHFIRDFKSLANTTPNRFLKMSVLYNKEIG
jgi:AraC-like DNA-binding protein